MIIRTEKKGNYTRLSNAFLLDETISDKARGLLARLLSRPDNWNLNINYLVKTGKDGDTAVRSAIKELIAAGYIEKDVRRQANGRIAGVAYTIHESPVKPSGDSPVLEERAQPCNETAHREVQGELFDETPMGAHVNGEQPREVRNEDTGIENNRMGETLIKETAPVIKTDIKQILKETTTTPDPEPGCYDQAMPLPPSSSHLEILNLIPEKHKRPMVISLVNKAIVDYPAKEVKQALAYAACNVRGGSMQFKAYLDKTLKNRWADGWEPELDEKQAARQEALAQLKRMPDSNLSVNARDAMPGGGCLTIETSGVTLSPEFMIRHFDINPGPYALIAVTDNGEGISKEVVGQIFEPFFTTKKRGKGTGLGLSTVYGIIKQNNGYIDVYSEPGQGTAFLIYLPRITDGKPGDVIEKPAEEPRDRNCTETILLVEDDAMLRRMVYDSLSSQGYTVLEAEDGKHGIAVFKDAGDTVDLLITDMVMPGKNGLEVARELQSSAPGLEVILMSGYTENSMIREGNIPEHITFIHKPVTPALLSRTVGMVLDQGVSGTRQALDSMLGKAPGDDGPEKFSTPS